MIRFNQGDIVAVKFPYTDEPGKYKLRPAVVISNKSMIEGEYIMIPVTSAPRNDEFTIQIKPGDLHGELNKISKMRCSKIFTVHADFMNNKRYATLKNEPLQQVLDMVGKIIQYER